MNKIRISKVVKNFYTNKSVVWIEIYEDNDYETVIYAGEMKLEDFSKLLIAEDSENIERRI